MLGHRRGLRRLLAARRPALRHRPARRRRLHAVDPGRRHLRLVLRSSAASSRARRSSRGSTPCTSCCSRRSSSALITAHIVLVVVQKHTQCPGPGRTNDNVVGYPLIPVYAAKAGGFFFIVFGVIALIVGAGARSTRSGRYGPYDPSPVTAGSQPDWYMGFADGALRLLPGWLEFERLRASRSAERLRSAPSCCCPLIYGRARHLPVPRDAGSPATSASTTCSTARATPRPAPALGHGRHHRLRRAAVRRAATTSWRSSCGLSINDITYVLAGRRSSSLPPIVVLGHQADLPVACSAATATLVLHGRETGTHRAHRRRQVLRAARAARRARPAGCSCSTSRAPLQLEAGVDENGVRPHGRRKDRLRATVSHFYFADARRPGHPGRARRRPPPRCRARGHRAVGLRRRAPDRGRRRGRRDRVRGARRPALTGRARSRAAHPPGCAARGVRSLRRVPPPDRRCRSCHALGQGSARRRVRVARPGLVVDVDLEHLGARPLPRDQRDVTGPHPERLATAARTAAVAAPSTALAPTDTPSTSSSPQRPPTRVLEAPGRTRTVTRTRPSCQPGRRPAPAGRPLR